MRSSFHASPARVDLVYTAPYGSSHPKNAVTEYGAAARAALARMTKNFGSALTINSNVNITHLHIGHRSPLLQKAIRNHASFSLAIACCHLQRSSFFDPRRVSRRPRTFSGDRDGSKWSRHKRG